ncbi:MAG: protein kinase [Gemmatimonadetes bacterium]|nr:protein kinase [Gemmatimonadota bacterium]
MTDPGDSFRAALADRYVVERELGSGGMATVYLAQDRKHRRKVAVKILKPELAALIGPARFLREIEIAAKLAHPHILPLYDSGEAEGVLYYVMPYVAGESLRERLSRERQLPVDDALQVAREVADALEYAHRHGVIHRDIKPENILLQERHAVVADFGIARAVSAAGGSRLTQTGLVVGTPAYMSPEQATGDPADHRSDIYALGCVVYEMLAGVPPFVGATVDAVLARRLTDPAPPVRTLRDLVPQHVDGAIQRALARTPADRFPTAAQFLEAIARVPGESPRRGWRPSPVVIAAAAAALVLAGGWALVSRWSAPPPAPFPRLAVFPFAVRGAGSFAYLGEGIVDLLTRNLDGVEGVRTIDPGTVLLMVAHDGSAVVDAGRARAIARRAGAGLYVLGSVHVIGGGLRLQAQLHDGAPDASPEAVAQVAVEGDTTEVFELVDRLAAELMVTRRRGPAERLSETAALTTRSLPALKAYLNAEAVLRAGGGNPGLDSAIAGFQRAIAEDTSFALAYYRLAVVAGWRGRHELAGSATARALASGIRLSERDRRLLASYAAYRSGTVAAAEAGYRSILRDYPDDLEADFQLADLLFNYNALMGRPLAESREIFDRVLDLDPGFL